ncbi:ImuA family protein [Ancylobacter lacus]|uniref:ImuA family protein n=1 Tax=Ancylobacter lacus TaxID=2579970 RepID=UPI001FE87362|nr:hypothetical protein [Ancylobacter lacus]
MLAGLEAVRLPSASSAFTLGAKGPDEVLAETLARGALHEIYAAEGGDMPAASGFALALALRALNGQGEARPLVWVRQDFLDSETGRPDARGVSGFGLDPARLILVRVRDPEQALRAAGDAVRCAALGAVLLEWWGEPKVLDLTATRRLALRASVSGVSFFLLRRAARASPSVAVTRWLVRPMLSTPLAADAPGAPAFVVTLLRHRAGVQSHIWNLEWDHESCSFRDIPPLSRPVVSVPAGKSAGPTAEPSTAALRRAG